MVEETKIIVLGSFRENFWCVYTMGRKRASGGSAAKMQAMPFQSDAQNSPNQTVSANITNQHKQALKNFSMRKKLHGGSPCPGPGSRHVTIPQIAHPAMSSGPGNPNQQGQTLQQTLMTTKIQAKTDTLSPSSGGGSRSRRRSRRFSRSRRRKPTHRRLVRRRGVRRKSRRSQKRGGARASRRPLRRAAYKKKTHYKRFYRRSR